MQREKERERELGLEAIEHEKEVKSGWGGREIGQRVARTIAATDAQPER